MVLRPYEIPDGVMAGDTVFRPGRLLFGGQMRDPEVVRREIEAQTAKLERKRARLERQVARVEARRERERFLAESDEEWDESIDGLLRGIRED